MVIHLHDKLTTNDSFERIITRHWEIMNIDTDFHVKKLICVSMINFDKL